MAKLASHLKNIALSHSIFALPFAYMGAFLAAGGIPSNKALLWITLAMLGARSSALALNNLIDLKYDKLQPRFARRPLVTGEIKPSETVVFIIGSLALFLLAASKLNPLCLKLSPLAVVSLVAYPYMKRVSWTCHLVLGLALAIAPVGAWIAVRGDFNLLAVLLGLAAGIWIAGFDVVYGCQDVEFDKQHGLHSIPVSLGVAKALKLSAIMHITSLLCFVAVGFLVNLHVSYYSGVVLAAAVLSYQHHIVSPGDLSQVTQKYFMRNGIVGIALFIFTLVDLLSFY